MKYGVLGAAAWLLSTAAGAQSVSDEARAFGARPAVEDISLSPDGARVAFVAPAGGVASTLFTVPVAEDSAPSPALSVDGKPDRLSDCRFVTDSRLVCTVWGAVAAAGYSRPIDYSRLIATDAAGGRQTMLTRQQV